jgi:glycosyltransferase involved in cell wall biosynthesis
MDKLPISCFIIAKNEADRIALSINSVKDWVDELIVVDSGSQDDTVRLSESLGAKVYFNAWKGYGLQKRFGEDQCRNDWILNIDADEAITPQLAQEIAADFAHGLPTISGFYLRVRDMLPGEKRLSPFAHTNRCLRLYDKRKARFSDSPVHDSVIVQEGETKILEKPVLHRSFRSLGHMLEKINSYSTMQAENLLQKKTLNHPYIRLMIEMPFGFLKSYFIRGYIFRGWRGFIYSIVYGYGRFIRIAKYLELQKKR